MDRNYKCAIWYLGYGATFVNICALNNVEFIVNVSGRLGKTAGAFNLFLTYRILQSDGHFSWGDKAQFIIGSLAYIGTNWNPDPTGISQTLSLGITVADQAGAFNNWYNAWDEAETMYNTTGLSIIPVRFRFNGISLPIIITRKSK